MHSQFEVLDFPETLLVFAMVWLVLILHSTTLHEQELVYWATNEKLSFRSNSISISSTTLHSADRDPLFQSPRRNALVQAL